MKDSRENLLDLIGFHQKWHGGQQNNRKKMKYSINEDLIEYIFKKIQIENGFFCEFGAWDGIHLSNCRKLFEKNWKGIFIEGEKEKYNQLVNNYKNTDIICENVFLESNGKNNINNIFKKYNINKIDFCSIDIDGLDLNIWKTFEIYPEVVCIEGGQVLHPLEKNIVPDNIMRDNVTQSLYNYNKIFNERGYKLIAAYQDLFFVKDKYYEHFNVSDDLMTLYLDGIKCLPRIPWLYEKMNQYKINNEIISKIMNKTKNKNFNNRNLWMNDNWDIIKKYLLQH